MIHEPSVLFVAWQCPANRAIYPVARLVAGTAAPRYEFVYIKGVQEAMTQGFQPFPRMRDPARAYRFDDLPPLFTNRLMPHTRPDYRDYLERLGLEGDPAPTVILGRSEGRKVTDTLEICAAPSFDAEKHEWIYHGFARGVRHVDGAEQAIAALHAGDGLVIERDLHNAFDGRALLLRRSDRAPVGFVPHTLVEDLGAILDLRAAVHATVVRVNHAPAPVHQRLLVEFRARHVDGFHPLSTERYQPLPEGATVVRLDPAVGAP